MWAANKGTSDCVLNAIVDTIRIEYFHRQLDHFTVFTEVIDVVVVLFLDFEKRTNHCEHQHFVIVVVACLSVCLLNFPTCFSLAFGLSRFR